MSSLSNHQNQTLAVLAAAAVATVVTCIFHTQYFSSHNNKKDHSKNRRHLQPEDFAFTVAAGSTTLRSKIRNFIFGTISTNHGAKSSNDDDVVVYWIQNVRIPIATLSQTVDETMVDEEGLVHCHVQINHSTGRIAAIVLAQRDKDFNNNNNSNNNEIVVEGHGCLFMPCFVDAHTHLVKTQVVPRLRNSTGTWSEALTVLEPQDEAKHWSKLDDVQRRMEFAIQCALHYGTKALRTHLDGCASNDPQIQATVYQAYDNMVAKYDDGGVMVLQGVANLYLPLWLEEPLATDHANRAAQHKGVVLGAYVGNPSTDSEKTESVQAMKALLHHAQRLNHLDVDLHIDESNDPSCCTLLLLIEALQQARDGGYQGRVVLGHCCSLALQSNETQTFICQQLALLQAHVVANPLTNLMLQDRRGSAAPQSRPIPATVPRTPQWRGMTLVQELDAATVNVSMASDNIRDHWNPFGGDYDLLTVWALGLQMGHLDTIPSPGAWAHLVTKAPAEAMGLSSYFAVGQPADGVLFPRARRISELLTRPQTDRIVLRQGRLVCTELPDYADLDDLILQQ